jgi:hypothetical protein
VIQLAFLVAVLYTAVGIFRLGFLIRFLRSVGNCPWARRLGLCPTETTESVGDCQGVGYSTPSPHMLAACSSTGSHQFCGCLCEACASTPECYQAGNNSLLRSTPLF